MTNVFYFKRICKIGGTEQFLYEIAKMFHDKADITIMYDEASDFQLARLRKLVRCRKHVKGRKVICSRAFFNFNIDAIDDIVSTENYYCFIAHAIYQKLGYQPPIKHPKLNHFIGVSKYSTDKLNEFAETIGLNIKCETCYNPITVEPVDKVLHLLSACRLNDKTKGGLRTKKLISILDEYCSKHNRHYVFDIYSNGVSEKIDSPNVNIKQGRIDIRPFIADADVIVTLSNDMETYCYTNVEALMYGQRILTTPLSVNKELGIPESAIYTVDWELKNAEEVIKKMFDDLDKGHGKSTFTAPKTNWIQYLAKSKPTYEEEKKRLFTVRALPSFSGIRDKETGVKRTAGDIWQVTFERLEELLNDKRDLIEVEETCQQN